ncbi:4-hydroxy-tetrahydrodipicolinate synthase [Marininema halotolerans]|uniref:4-hydroxy-tetrahydrodipicolinate synthase n=1 Tax=Marininema halotolerans TaxID=1155944 RepID=A0A1I6R5X6_9BACL|nr:4-hydroxy-tetrahydrodipicolinate synthase [Marininema halotolerans]SFS59938.1 4-hydroxy-tetrahydrodipicolinate synthase [Marininema halotolerans]
MTFGRIMTAMITPMHQTGDIDWNGVEAVLEHLVATGTEGIVVSGTTGESPTLTQEEKVQLFTYVVERVKGRVNVIAGTGSNDTRSSMELTKRAADCGVDGIMLVAPYYNKPTQEGLFQHFSTIAKTTTLPIMVYNVPGRTSVNMSADTMVRLSSEVDNIQAIKEASGNLVQVMDVISNKPENVVVHSGVDELNLPYLSVGGDGVVSVASHLVGMEMKEMLEAFDRGEIAHAAEIQRKHLPLIRALFMTSSPAPLKYAMNRLGICEEHVRMPVIPLSAEEKLVMDRLLDELQLLK